MFLVHSANTALVNCKTRSALDLAHTCLVFGVTYLPDLRTFLKPQVDEGQKRGKGGLACLYAFLLA